jgi:hypothetical protein
VKAGPSEQPAFATGPKDDRCLDFGSKVDAGVEDGVLAEGERLDFAVADEGGARFALHDRAGYEFYGLVVAIFAGGLDAGFLELLDDAGFGPARARAAGIAPSMLSSARTLTWSLIRGKKFCLRSAPPFFSKD